MRAARYYGAEDVRIEDLPDRSVTRDEVKVNVEWCGICGTDKMVYSYDMPYDTPLTIGHECSGVVAEVGEDITHVKVGDRVVIRPTFPCGKCNACLNGPRNLCENLIPYGIHGDYGAFAESTIVPGEAVFFLPENIPFDVAALTEPIGVGLHALRISQFKPGDDVAVIGGGAIGLLFVSLLSAFSASKIILITRTESKRKLAEKLGATLTIDPISQDCVDEVINYTNGGVSMAFDMVGAQDTLAQCVTMLKPRGQVVVAGGLHYNTAVPYDLMTKELNILGSMCTLDEVPRVLDLLAAGKIRTEGIVTKKVYLDDVVEEGLETFLNDSTQIKILVTPKKENL